MKKIIKFLSMLCVISMILVLLTPHTVHASTKKEAEDYAKKKKWTITDTVEVYSGCENSYYPFNFGTGTFSNLSISDKAVASYKVNKSKRVNLETGKDPEYESYVSFKGLKPGYTVFTYTAKSDDYEESKTEHLLVNVIKFSNPISSLKIGNVAIPMKGTDTYRVNYNELTNKKPVIAIKSNKGCTLQAARFYPINPDTLYSRYGDEGFYSVTNNKAITEPVKENSYFEFIFYNSSTKLYSFIRIYLYKGSKPKNIAVKSISLSKGSLTLAPKASSKLTVKFNPSNASNKKITWSTSNKKIVTISSNGTVKAIKAGSATITAKSNNGKKASCKVTVKKPVAVKGVSLDKKTLILTQGSTSTLKVNVNPKNASNKSISWSTGNKKIVTVSAGKIKAVGVGSTKVTAKSHNGKTATCTITVKKKPVQKYTVKFDVNGGLLTLKSKTYKKDEKLGVLPNTSKSGHLFDGWYTSKTGGSRVTDKTKVTKNMTLYAHWTKGVTITFNENGGKAGRTSLLIRPNSSCGSLFPTATRDQYNFLGWYTKLEGGTKINKDTPIKENITLYAHYETKEIRVNYDVKGGASIYYRDFDRHGRIGKLAEAYKSGYDFNGWYTSPKGGTKVTGEETYDDHITLYAHWTKRYSIINVDEKGIYSQNQSYLNNKETFKRGDVLANKYIELMCNTPEWKTHLAAFKKTADEGPEYALKMIFGDTFGVDFGENEMQDKLVIEYFNTISHHKDLMSCYDEIKSGMDNIIEAKKYIIEGVKIADMITVLKKAGKEYSLFGKSKLTEDELNKLYDIVDNRWSEISDYTKALGIVSTEVDVFMNIVQMQMIQKSLIIKTMDLIDHDNSLYKALAKMKYKQENMDETIAVDFFVNNLDLLSDIMKEAGMKTLSDLLGESLSGSIEVAKLFYKGLSKVIPGKSIDDYNKVAVNSYNYKIIKQALLKSLSNNKLNISKKDYKFLYSLYLCTLNSGMEAGKEIASKEDKKDLELLEKEDLPKMSYEAYIENCEKEASKEA